MKFGIDWSQASTRRGAIWLVTAVIGSIMLLTGQGDVSQLLLLASAVAGGLGVAVRD